ncbi:MAG: LLM class flavin-dependent oxidoreductase [Pseudomonadota bacterium]
MHLAVSLNIASVAGQSGLTFGETAGFVREAEAAGIDMVVISDAPGSGERSSSPFEATTLVAALATVTDRIGLVASASTLAHQPYNLARRFASLDIISHGRIGWNATMAQNPREAANFSRPEGFSDDDFRRRAAEYIDIVRGLWRGWDADALLFDKAGGRFHDPEQMHLLDHRGEFFSVRGPLNVARSPQDAPLLVMSGLVEADLDFAARVADVVVIHDQQPEAATADLKRRAAAAGRKIEALKTLAAIDAGPVLAHRIEAVRSGGCYGALINLPAHISAIKDFSDRILPELNRLGVLHTAYRTETLRERLGLGAGGTK